MVARVSVSGAGELPITTEGHAGRLRVSKGTSYGTKVLYPMEGLRVFGIVESLKLVHVASETRGSQKPTESIASV